MKLHRPVDTSNNHTIFIISYFIYLLELLTTSTSEEEKTELLYGVEAAKYGEVNVRILVP
jgi:hypothetical protein